MTVEINDEEKVLITELLEHAEQDAIRGLDHSASRAYKDLLRKRLEILESAKGKLRGERTLREV